MPINLREGEDAGRAGNQFAPARFEVPIGERDPAARVKQIHELVAAQRAEPALPFADGVSAALARLPRAVSTRLLGSMLKAIDLVTSNVPGPTFAVYASGARVERMFGYGPLSGAACNITLFSYDGVVRFAISTDPAAVPDPERFVDCLRGGVDEVLGLG